MGKIIKLVIGVIVGFVLFVRPSTKSTSIESSSLDLVGVAQALHWFDFDRFYAEVRRVWKPGGILAVWSYGLFRVDGPLDTELDHFYQKLNASWPPERKYVESGYRDVPFDEISPPEFHIEAEWNIDNFFGYLITWSAAKNSLRRTVPTL